MKQNQKKIVIDYEFGQFLQNKYDDWFVLSDERKQEIAGYELEEGARARYEADHDL